MHAKTHKKLAIIFAVSTIILGICFVIVSSKLSSCVNSIDFYHNLLNRSESIIISYQYLLDESNSNFSYYLNACYEREKEYQNMLDEVIGNSHTSSNITAVYNPLNNSYFGGRIVAADGQFLGVINSNEYDSDSLANSYGTYGNEYNSYSIWNKYGIYGSPYSTYSAYNPYTNSPPSVFLNGEFYAYLTKNTFKSPRLDPDVVAAIIGR